MICGYQNVVHGALYTWNKFHTLPLIDQQNSPCKLMLYSQALFKHTEIILNFNGRVSIDSEYTRFIFGKAVHKMRHKELTILFDEIIKYGNLKNRSSKSYYDINIPQCHSVCNFKVPDNCRP